MSLADDLKVAERESFSLGCSACAFLDSNALETTKDEVRTALSSRIGKETLAAIFRKHDIPIGRTSIQRHRGEGHQ